VGENVQGRHRVAIVGSRALPLGVYLSALTGFRNRVAVLPNRTIAFLGRGRPQRAITAQQVFAREALEAATVASKGGK